MFPTHPSNHQNTPSYQRNPTIAGNGGTNPNFINSRSSIDNLNMGRATMAKKTSNSFKQPLLDQNSRPTAHYSGGFNQGYNSGPSPVMERKYVRPGQSIADRGGSSYSGGNFIGDIRGQSKHGGSSGYGDYASGNTHQQQTNQGMGPGEQDELEQFYEQFHEEQEAEKSNSRGHSANRPSNQPDPGNPTHQYSQQDVDGQVYYEAEMDSTAAPSYNPGYLVKEGHPFQSFPDSKVDTGYGGQQEAATNNPLGAALDQLHSYPPPAAVPVPDRRERERKHMRDLRAEERRKYTDHERTRSRDRHEDRSGRREEPARHHEGERWRSSRYPAGEQEEEHKRGRTGDPVVLSADLSQHRGSTDLSQHRGGTDLSQHRGSTDLSQHRGGDHHLREEYRTRRRSPPSAPRPAVEDPTLQVQNILSSLKSTKGSSMNPLLIKAAGSGKATDKSANIPDFLMSAIRDVAKQMVEEKGFNETLNLMGKAAPEKGEKFKAKSPLKITTTRKHKESRRSRSRSRSRSRDRSSRRSKDKRSRHRKRHSSSSPESPTRRSKASISLDNDNIKRVFTDSYPKLAAATWAMGALPPPVAIPTGALPPPLPLPPNPAMAAWQFPPPFGSMPPLNTIPGLGGLPVFNPIVSTAGMLPPPVASAAPHAELPRPATGRMPNKAKKAPMETLDQLKCSPCNLNFKTKKGEQTNSCPPSPTEIDINPIRPAQTALRTLTPGPLGFTPAQAPWFPPAPTIPNTPRPNSRFQTELTHTGPVPEGHVIAKIVGGEKAVPQATLSSLDTVRGLDIIGVVDQIKRQVDIMQFKWGFEVTTLAPGWQDISDNQRESSELLATLHKTVWEASKGYLVKKGFSSDAVLVREKEIWDVFAPISQELCAVDASLHRHGKVSGPFNPSFCWAVEPQRNKIRELLIALQDLAYEKPPDTFKYLDKWGDDLGNIRHEIRKSIDVIQLLIGSNFEGSTTWDEIINLVKSCVETLDALKNMCFQESGKFMRKGRMGEGVGENSVVERRLQIGNVFNAVRADMVCLRNYAQEKGEARKPFVQLHLLEYRRQKLIDLVQALATL